MEMTRERLSFTFDPRDTLVSLKIGFIFCKSCSGLRNSRENLWFEPSSESTATGFLGTQLLLF